ncbi:hypothetical protein QBC43DRAFT_38263 [Cladorrhinum sp. PSN259]|nr:hypothetical protein QBC43DRAFT_38263 [Cladorrhinum sp. PSN259]
MIKQFEMFTVALSYLAAGRSASRSSARWEYYLMAFLQSPKLASFLRHTISWCESWDPMLLIKPSKGPAWARFPFGHDRENANGQWLCSEQSEPHPISLSAKPQGSRCYLSCPSSLPRRRTKVPPTIPPPNVLRLLSQVKSAALALISILSCFYSHWQQNGSSIASSKKLKAPLRPHNPWARAATAANSAPLELHNTSSKFTIAM